MRPQSRKIFDSLHGFIRLDDVETFITKSRPFERLRYIHQLGVAYLIYPGAVHKRYEHSLGVMHLATLIFDHLVEALRPPEPAYARAILRAAALCHDLGHLPFSHSAEKALLQGGHEAWTEKIILSDLLNPAWEALSKKYDVSSAEEVKEAVTRLAVSKVHRQSPSWERVLNQIITGDFFGADRIDYLLRDARTTGVAYGLFDYHQLIEMLCIVTDGQGDPLLAVEENGLESCESLLVARYFMHRRVYQYLPVKAFARHLAAFMQKEYVIKDLQTFLTLTDYNVLTAIADASTDPSHAAHHDAQVLMRLRPRTEEFAIEIEEVPSKETEDFWVLMRDGQLCRGKELSGIRIQ